MVPPYKTWSLGFEYFTQCQHHVADMIQNMILPVGVEQDDFDNIKVT